MRRLVSVSIAFALVFISCSKDSVSGGQGEDILDGISYQASIETVRDERGGKVSLSWPADARVRLIAANGYENMQIGTTEESSEAEFQGLLKTESPAFALYPASSFLGWDDQKQELDFSLGNRQTFSAEVYGMRPAVMIASLEQENRLQFRHLTGIFALGIKGEGSVRTVTISDLKGAALWGDFSVELSREWGMEDLLPHYKSGGSRSIALDCGRGVALSARSTQFLFWVPRGTLTQGVLVTLFMQDGSRREITVDTPVSISRAAVSLSANNWSTVGTVQELMNGSMIKYISDHYITPYRDGDYTYTDIESYCSGSGVDASSQRTDLPQPALFGWDAATGATSPLTLHVSTDSGFSDVVYSLEGIDSMQSGQQIYNLIPGSTYHYRVMSDSGVELWRSTVTTSGYRRCCMVDGVYNVRDLGGIPIAGGKRIRYGMIFRGGRMNASNIAITERGIEQMRQLGIRADLDLRKDAEAENITKSPLTYGVDYVRFPTSSSAFYQKLHDNDVNIREMQWLIDRLKENKPVYFHCHVGADRTGTLAWLIEGLLGVNENDMSIDYELTSFSNPPGLRRRTTKPYDYAGMYAAIMRVEGSTLQQKFYNYFAKGVSGNSISREDLDWFISFMTERVR